MDYAVQTKKIELQLKPDAEFREQVFAFADASYASDKDVRCSITGFAIFMVEHW